MTNTINPKRVSFLTPSLSEDDGATDGVDVGSDVDVSMVDGHEIRSKGVNEKDSFRSSP
eukprot:CAMPEP_0170787290 /NCGR_PEP_ID=MMETSP0733-20121128/18202_1 /TAXON_ID=186038 /ORGANISM="Fragilariopsis kerguelensis, Strain L26-C5" /LENGTH=58 /DNA_ID=CAMNT_0011133483 /DNA_START=96 /DNA_END=272 /DNA_ORIENTATION=-